jgi:hypothetical protein
LAAIATAAVLPIVPLASMQPLPMWGCSDACRADLIAVIPIAFGKGLGLIHQPASPASRRGLIGSDSWTGGLRSPQRSGMFEGSVLFKSMLTGSELLAKVKEIGDASKSDLVRACGYVSTKKDGTERLNFTAFYEALLEAKGVSLGEGGGKAAAGKGGRKLSYVATVQGNGNLLVGKAYTALLDLKPGDEFEIKLGRKQIRLVPAGSDDEE